MKVTWMTMTCHTIGDPPASLRLVQALIRIALALALALFPPRIKGGSVMA